MSTRTKNSTDALFIGGPVDGMWMDDPGAPEWYVATCDPAFDDEPKLMSFKYRCIRMSGTSIYVAATLTDTEAFTKLLRGYVGNQRKGDEKEAVSKALNETAIEMGVEGGIPKWLVERAKANLKKCGEIEDLGGYAGEEK